MTEKATRRGSLQFHRQCPPIIKFQHQESLKAALTRAVSMGRNLQALPDLQWIIRMRGRGRVGKERSGIE